MLLERLREEADYMSVKDYNMIAFDLREDAGLVKSVVEDFGLFAFTDDRKCFYSESFNRRMGVKDEISRMRSGAGKASAQRRWGNKEVTDVTEMGNKEVTDVTEMSNKEVTDVTRKDAKQSKQRKEESEKRAPAHEDVNDCYLEKFFSSNSALLEALLINLHLSPGDRGRLREVAEEIVNEWKISEAFHTSYRDWSSHLISTIRIKLQKSKPETAAEKSSAQLRQAREERDKQNAERRKRYDEMRRGAVSREEALNSEEYRRAMQEA